MSKFNPATWVEQAEALGYGIYLWDGFGDGALGLIVMNPVEPCDQGSRADLWSMLRPPDEAQSDFNEKALFFHLWDSGRVGPEEMRPGYAKGFSRADVGRQSARHLEILRRREREAI